MLVFAELVLWFNILLDLIIKRELFYEVWFLKLFYLTFLCCFLGQLLVWVILWIVIEFPAIILKLVVIIVGEVLKFKLLLKVFLKNVRDDLGVEVLLAVELINLLFLTVEDANEYVKLAKLWQLHGFFEKVILPFGYCWSLD